MAVAVSDTTPLHYLILIGRDSVLEKLYRQRSSMHLDPQLAGRIIAEYEKGAS